MALGADPMSPDARDDGGLPPVRAAACNARFRREVGQRLFIPAKLFLAGGGSSSSGGPDQPTSVGSKNNSAGKK